MTKVINVQLNSASIDAAIRELQEYSKWVQRKADELAHRLADMGAVNVSFGFSRAIYTGDNDVSVTVEQRSENSYSIVANGKAVAFIEFGAGVTYGYGHPKPTLDGMAMGPGTYPDKHYSRNSRGELVENWQNDLGWYIPGGEHTYGNPPNMPMYQTASELRRDLERIAREVFST